MFDRVKYRPIPLYSDLIIMKVGNCEEKEEKEELISRVRYVLLCGTR